MKKVIFLLVSFVLLASCSEQDVKPDLFSGSWTFTSSEPSLQIYFDAVRINEGVYNIENRSVIHPAIPVEEQGNNQIKLYDKFENGTGYGMIEITSRGDFYYKISLIYNRFTEEGEMLVYDIQVDIPSEPFTVLNDQVFVRKN